MSLPINGSQTASVGQTTTKFTRRQFFSGLVLASGIVSTADAAHNILDKVLEPISPVYPPLTRDEAKRCGQLQHQPRNRKEEAELVALEQKDKYWQERGEDPPSGINLSDGIRLITGGTFMATGVILISEPNSTPVSDTSSTAKS